VAFLLVEEDDSEQRKCTVLLLNNIRHRLLLVYLYLRPSPNHVRWHGAFALPKTPVRFVLRLTVFRLF
jgi:hypothetical protein